MRYYTGNIKTFYQLWQDILTTQIKCIVIQRPTCEPVMQHKKTSLALKYGSSYQTPSNLHTLLAQHTLFSQSA